MFFLISMKVRIGLIKINFVVRLQLDIEGEHNIVGGLRAIIGNSPKDFLVIHMFDKVR